MQATRTIHLDSVLLVPTLLGMTKEEQSQQLSGQPQQRAHYCLPTLKALLRKRLVGNRQC